MKGFRGDGEDVKRDPLGEFADLHFGRQLPAAPTRDVACFKPLPNRRHILKERYLALHRPLEQRSGDDQSIDLVGSFEDPVDARIPKKALGLKLFDEAVAAVNLNGLV